MRNGLKQIIRSTGLRRHHVAAARMYCERHILAATRAARKRSRGRILCYHSIGQRASGVNDVTPARFRRQIESAIGAGYRFVPARNIAREGGTPKDLAITFDDAWTSVLTHAAPILRDYGIPFSLFVVSDWCEHRSPWQKDCLLDWEGVERVMAFGAEIGSHSLTHPDFGAIDPARMHDELAGSRQAIEKRLGISPTTFAIPLGQSANWSPAAASAARQAGYEIVYAQAEETRPTDTVARTFVTKFDGDRIFNALLQGAFDRWEEWV
jgi:peptidoglycan/xylan/chitin deacetylase (PgdA/CDA1 family)